MFQLTPELMAMIQQRIAQMRGLGGGLPGSPNLPAGPAKPPAPPPPPPAVPSFSYQPQPMPANGAMPMLRDRMMSAVLPTLQAPGYGVPVPGGINEQPGKQQVPNLNLPIGWRV